MLCKKEADKPLPVAGAGRADRNALVTLVTPQTLAIRFIVVCSKPSSAKTVPAASRMHCRLSALARFQRNAVLLGKVGDSPVLIDLFTGAGILHWHSRHQSQNHWSAQTSCRHDGVPR